MPLVNSSKQEILLPAKGWFIVFSLSVALLLNLLPLQDSILALRPDFVALVLLYWNINQSHRIGMGTAFGMGLLMDVGDASLFGQHALAYVVMAFLALALQRRMRLFNLVQQAPQAGIMMLAAQVTMLLAGLLGGANFSGMHFFLPSITGALLWPLLSALLRNPQRPKADPDAL